MALAIIDTGTDRIKSAKTDPDILEKFGWLAKKAGEKSSDLDLLGERADTLILDLIEKEPDLTAIFNAVSSFNEAVTCTIIQNRFEELIQKTDLHNLVPFCWINMGSDARREQVARTDQDNALIYADPPRDQKQETEAFYSRLAQEVVKDLDRFGFRLCKGNVMATNPVWRRSLSQWLKVLDQWVGSAEPEDVRKLTILLDFRPLCGDKALARKLQSRVLALFDKNVSVSHYLTRDDSLFASPKTFFGRIRTQKGKQGQSCFNLKTTGLAHLVNCIRILALNNGIRPASTLDRMDGLLDKKVLSPFEYGKIRAAFFLLTRLKIKNHLGKKNPGTIPVNCIDLSSLSNKKTEEFKRALYTISRLQKRVNKTYNVPWMNFFN